MRRSTLSTLGVLASIFFCSLVVVPLLAPLERIVYDWCLRNAHDFGYDSERRHPALKLLSYTESTAKDLGEWNLPRSQRMVDGILKNGAQSLVVHPAAQSELEVQPDPANGLFVAAPSPISRSLPLRIDGDGVCRRVALAGKEGDGKSQRWSAALPLLVYARSQNVPASEIAFLPSAIRVGSRTVPTDSDYTVAVRFRRASEALSGKRMDDDDERADIDRMMPAAVSDYLKNEAFFSRLYQDKIVLLGTGFKQASARVQTPLGQVPDYIVEACVLETLLSEWHLSQPDRQEQGAALLATVALCLLVFRQLPIAGIAIAWGALQLLALWSCQKLFTLEISPQYTPLLVSSSLTALLVTRSKLLEASAALRRFGGLGAVEAAKLGDESVFEEVREKTATIVFTNVLSYLKELERHGSPDDFFARRQDYAQFLSDTFRKHGGVVLDYQGDFQMVGFNVELRSDDPGHALHALQACQEFLERLSEVTKTWKVEDQADLGTAHCGICTGPVACGHVGSQRHDGGRIAQAAIGDTSNVAARLLGAAMKSKEPILLAMTTVESAAGAISHEELEAIPLKGKSQAVPVARPVGER